MKVTISFTLDYEMAKWLEGYSARLKIAKSVMVNQIIRDRMEKVKEMNTLSGEDV